ncbi:hypothetical protein RHMOL_Rhmol02G0169900 [Rhododendron molle]|uniref:Uncharacterized protein n=2 Tax=Rhododendron molle TaxID=49168 RepID=A0ACC0PQW2_RHOML|nr:hypothetical protein RHMOL_Rhmol02G0169900 [Rhododendron molle]KAI8568085.1 hypothetical protein RHMOL_Rhmol02G0169900 [Rhododendron molle]
MAGKDEGDGWIAKTPPPTATRAETNRTRARRRRPNPLSESASNLREDDYYHDCYWLRSTPGRIIQGLETRKTHPNDRVEQSRRNVDLESRTPSTQPENSNAMERRNDNTCLYKKLVDPRKHRPRVFGEGNKKRTPKPAKHDGAPSKRKLCKDMEIACEPIQQPGAKSCKRSLDFTLENMEVEDQTTCFNENRSGYDPKYLQVYQRKKLKFTACSNLQSVMNRKYGSREMQPEELIDASVKRAEYQEISNGCAQLSVNENTSIMKDHLKAKLELDGQKMRGQKQLMDKDDCEAPQEGGMDRERRLQQERKLLPRVESFIAQMQRVQGDRHYLPWKCSVVDSVVGAFLTQNVKDTSSSSAFMSLASKYPRRIVDKNKPPRKNFASSTSTARKGTQVSSTVNLDCVEWNEVRSATVEEISEVIKERGMNNKIAERIKMCLDRIADEKGSIDLERLRSATPEEAKKYLMSIQGLGLKSVECIRLLTLNHPAFPVDTNVARIVVRLGWVPIEPLPEGIQMHLLNKYPKENSIQKYLSPLLSTFDHGKLYELHYHMITFGKVCCHNFFFINGVLCLKNVVLQAFCTKEKPNCNACPMRVECEFAREEISYSFALYSKTFTKQMKTNPLAKPYPLIWTGAQWNVTGGEKPDNIGTFLLATGHRNLREQFEVSSGPPIVTRSPPWMGQAPSTPAATPIHPSKSKLKPTVLISPLPMHDSQANSPPPHNLITDCVVSSDDDHILTLSDKCLACIFRSLSSGYRK